MKRREFSIHLAGAGLALTAAAPALAQAPVEGTHYIKLAQPLAAALLPQPGKIDVTEFFWYECPHCNAFEPLLEPWAKKLPADPAAYTLYFMDDGTWGKETHAGREGFWVRAGASAEVILRVLDLKPIQRVVLEVTERASIVVRRPGSPVCRSPGHRRPPRSAVDRSPRSVIVETAIRGNITRDRDKLHRTA